MSHLRKFAAFGIAVATCIAAMQCNSAKPVSAQGNNLPRITISLLGSAKAISTKGLDVDTARHFLRSGDLLAPHILTIRTAEGKAITVRARSASYLCDDDHQTVVDLYVRRPMRPMRFQAVVADLQKTVREMGAQPSKTMLEMSKWGDVPGWEQQRVMPNDYSAGGVMLGPHVDLSVRMMPDRAGGWFYLMSIGVDPEMRPSIKAIRAEQRARRAATHSTSKPAIAPGTFENPVERRG